MVRERRCRRVSERRLPKNDFSKGDSERWFRKLVRETQHRKICHPDQTIGLAFAHPIVRPAVSLLEPANDRSVLAGRPTAGSPRVAQDGPNEFNHPRGNSEEEADNADPRSMKPAVEGGAQEPSGNRTGWKHECELAVAAYLHPRILLLVARLLWSGRVKHWLYPDQDILRSLIQASVGRFNWKVLTGRFGCKACRERLC
jgi:hypothetical protein